MNAQRAIWLGLAVLAAAWSLLLGVPLWLGLAVLSCAITPSTAGFLTARTGETTQVEQLEIGLWVGLATLAAASTGGAVSPLNILYAVPIALAWMAGSSRLTGEAVGFSLLGYVAAVAASSGGAWLDPGSAGTISVAFSASGLAMLGLLAALGVARTSLATMAGVEPIKGVTEDPAVSLKIRQAEARARAAEQQLATAHGETQRAMERLDGRTRFFAQTSHEIRTPLNAIIGFAEMMKNAVFGPLPDRYQEYVELIHEGGRDLSLVVDDVLDLSRIDAGKFDISPEPVSLTDLAEDAVRFMGDMAARKQVDLAFQDGEDVEAFADAKAVRQIALNLISNALKFTPAGGEVKVSAIETTGGSLLAVADTGAGISAEEITRLSRAFEQGEAGRKQKGAGLGLSVVRAFADLHGGRLDIESREGGGTTIAVFFPAEKKA